MHSKAFTLAITFADAGRKHATFMTTTSAHTDIVAASTEAVIDAAKQCAGAGIDYDSFGNDSAYLERVDQVASALKVVEITKSIAGTKPVRYLVEGAYSNYPEGGRWSDCVFAIDDEDATLQAKFIMACGEQSGKFPTVAEYADFASTMDEELIDRHEVELVTKSDLIALIDKLVSSASALLAEPGSIQAQATLTATLAEARQSLDLIDQLPAKHV